MQLGLEEDLAGDAAGSSVAPSAAAGGDDGLLRSSSSVSLPPQSLRPAAPQGGSFPPAHLALALGLSFTAKLGVRFILPFAPFLAEQLDVSAQRILVLSGLMDVAGIVASALMGTLTDLFGPVRVLAAAVALFALAGATVAVAPQEYVVLQVAWLAWGFAALTSQVSIQTDLSRRVPPAQLGQVTSRLEASWGLSALVGFPLVGVLLQRVGYRAPFVFLAICAACTGGMFVAALRVHGTAARALVELGPVAVETDAECASASEDTRAACTATATIATATIATTRVRPAAAGYRDLFRVYVVSAWCFAALQQLSFMVFFANVGIWLADQFGLDAESVGWVTPVIGLAELGGAVASSVLTDRVGPRRSVLGAGCLLMVVCGLVALIGNVRPALPVAMAVLFCFFFAAEYQTICGIAMASSTLKRTSLPPQLMGLFMGVYFCALTGGRMVAQFIAAPVMDFGGLSAVAAWGAAVALAALVVVGLGCQDEVQGGPERALGPRAGDAQ